MVTIFTQYCTSYLLVLFVMTIFTQYCTFYLLVLFVMTIFTNYCPSLPTCMQYVWRTIQFFNRILCGQPVYCIHF